LDLVKGTKTPTKNNTPDLDENWYVTLIISHAMISVQPRSLSFYTLRISLVGRIYSSIMTPHDEVLSNHDVHTIIEYKSCPPSFTHEPRTEHLPLSQPWMEFPKIDPSHPFVYKRRGSLLPPTHTSPSSLFLHFL
jgi:hypothetical protein